MLKSFKKIALFGTMVLALVLLSTIICFANDGGAEVLHGDVNGDTKIDLADVIKFRIDLAKEINGELNLGECYDLDGDDVVGIDDLVTLRRFLADYDFSEVPSGGFDIDTAEKVYEYTSGDGATTWQYNDATMTDFEDLCKYFKSKGYATEYCSNTVGELISITYTGFGNKVATITYNGSLNELYVTKSASGAQALPVVGEDYIKNNATTVTQQRCVSNEWSGMSYIIRLADGSFIIVDGGFETDAKAAYETLCRLNGSSEGIRIRAWLMTHAHSDHYMMFQGFSKEYAQSVTLDTFLCSPVVVEGTENDYLNTTVKDDVARFEGAKLGYVRTGMSFELADVTVEVLVAPEQIYKDKNDRPTDFNESSVVYRVKNDEGSIIFLGDSCSRVSNWLIASYGDALKSDMVQVSHHGANSATKDLYDHIKAATVFWPCDEQLMITEQGEYVKQHILEADYSKEHILHGYGTATRPLSYKANTEYLDIMPKDVGAISGGQVTNIRIDDGVLRYEVTNASDPKVWFDVNLDTSKYNAIKLVVDPADVKNAVIYFRVSGDSGFTDKQEKGFKVEGKSDDGKMTIILYLGNVATYNGTLTHLRIDLGDTVGETIDIYSVEAYYVAVD